jgi:hypothetical protein
VVSAIDESPGGPTSRGKMIWKEMTWTEGAVALAGGGPSRLFRGGGRNRTAVRGFAGAKGGLSETCSGPNFLVNCRTNL